jgi:tetraacyldisaccharide 4'-kinase
MVKPEKAPVPVICVGNAVAGGSGKTPVVAQLAGMLSTHNPAILSRGYGAKIQGVLKVDAQTHSAADVGDEPLLLAHAGFAVYASPDRVAAAKQAVADGAGVLIMDDGFQSPYLHQDVKLLCVNAAQGFGNGFTIPAGPCREAPQAAMKRADAVIITGEERALDTDTPVFHARRITQLPDDTTTPYVAFAGIAHPQAFFDALARGGLTLAAVQPFADHHAYSADDLAMLQQTAQHFGAKLITTEKDAVRLPEDFSTNVASLALEWAQPDVFTQWLKHTLEGAHE